jgi:hypothetical protein
MRNGESIEPHFDAAAQTNQPDPSV